MTDHSLRIVGMPGSPYVESRSERLDAVLERAGILPFFADHVARAGSIPDFRQPPRPALNRPFPPDAAAGGSPGSSPRAPRSEEHTSELQSQSNLGCRLLL